MTALVVALVLKVLALAAVVVAFVRVRAAVRAAGPSPRAGLAHRPSAGLAPRFLEEVDSWERL